ncbi:MAG: hypothetical protein LUH20_00985, partial [Lachnospiraceae bacterium]|nr:hypothetical protein [Lachnospiraceae bacterium]
MKRKIRNSLLLVLSLILAFAMAVGVSASEPTYSITISNAAGQQTYTVYKVFDATYSSAGTSYTIDSTTNPWYDLVSTTGSPFTLTPTAADPDVYVVTVANTISSSDISDWFESLTDSQLQSVSSTIVGTQTSSVNAGETETLTFDLDGTNAGAGYYFITTTLGSLVTVDTANPKATVQEKNGVPSVEKQVSNDGSAYSSSNTAAIGDTVYFKSTITNFAGTYDLKVLVDNMDMGLTLNTSSIEVTYYANANDTSGTTLTSNVTIDTTNSADGEFSI